MKILMVSNLYPPYFVGGYELRCALVAEGLQSAGHEVRILTSRFGLDGIGPFEEASSEVRVQRVLGQYFLGRGHLSGWPYFLRVVRPQLQDAKIFNRVLNDFKPEVVNWWSVRGLTKAILSIPQLRGIPDVFCIEDDWIVEERSRGGWGERPPWAVLWDKNDKRWYWRPALLLVMERWKKKLLKQGIYTEPIPFCPTHVCFVSHFLRDEFIDAGIEFSSTEVIYGGVEVRKFFSLREWPLDKRKPLRLLYAGQVTVDRGLQTIINALNLLSPEALSSVMLTVVGDPIDAGYFREVRQHVLVRGLSEKVIFEGKKDYNEMPDVYRRNDVLISPSLRNEGLPLTMMEALLAGCVVVTTGSGGAMEIARLAALPLFPKGDAMALSRLLEHFIGNRRVLENIATRGQSVALQEFSSVRMIERYLNTFQKVLLSCKPCTQRKASLTFAQR